MAVTQYIGSRYVPLFADPIEWSASNTYEPLTIVLHEGNSYTSKQAVPKGIDIANEAFWALTGNYNAQVELYRRETAAAKEAADDAQADIDTLLPKSDFSAENTVKKYVDDSVEEAKSAAQSAQDDIDTLLPKSAFDATNTVKDYVDALDVPNSYNRTVDSTFVEFNNIGAFPISACMTTQGMTIDEDGNFYLAVIIGTQCLLRKYTAEYEYVNQVALPAGAHANAMDYSIKYGVLVFDSPTSAIYQYDKDLSLINTISSTMHVGCGAVSTSSDVLVAIPTTGNRAFVYFTNENKLTRIGEIDIGPTNACFQQDGFGGSNTFYQMFSAPDTFKHDYVRCFMYRGRKIRDIIILGIDKEVEGIARYDGTIYIVDIDGKIYTAPSDVKWSFSSSDTVNGSGSNNFSYSSSIEVTNETVNFQNADSRNVTASIPYEIVLNSGPFGNVQNFIVPVRLFNGKLGDLYSANGNIRLNFNWFGFQMVAFYTKKDERQTYRLNGIDTYVNGIRTYTGISSEADVANLATVLAGTHTYQVDTGSPLFPTGGITDNFVDESVSGKTLIQQ